MLLGCGLANSSSLFGQNTNPPPLEKYTHIHQSLLGPQGPTLRATLSGRHKTLDGFIASHDAAARSGGATASSHHHPSRPSSTAASKYGAVDAVGLAAAEEGKAPTTALPPSSAHAGAAAKGKLDGGGGEGEGQKLTVGLVWRAVKQVVFGSVLNVLLLTLPFGGLSGAWGFVCLYGPSPEPTIRPILQITTIPSMTNIPLHHKINQQRTWDGGPARPSSSTFWA